MLGICLKRYTILANGIPCRLNTHVDIPLEMGAPHFVSNDLLEDTSTLTGNFKLSLQSIVCHRGSSPSAGHYIALVRTCSPGIDHDASFATLSNGNAHNQSHDTWLRLDDMASERVAEVDITEALKNEMPYLLFYRVLPVNGDLQEEPPPYSETNHDQFVAVDQKLATIPTENGHGSTEAANWQSKRGSLEIANPDDIPGRISVPMTPSDDSRNGFMIPWQTLKNGKSAGAGRPASDGSEKRFSLSMAKLTARLSRDKMANSDVVVNEVLVDGPPLTFDQEQEPATEPSKVELNKAKPKEKRKKFNPMGRRGSTAQSKPDRECAVM